MLVRKQEDKNIRKLTKLGGKSIAVTIPVEYIREFGWREHQKVVVHKSGKKLIIEDWGK